MKHISKGFTLIELLVVVSIIGLLSTLVVVALNSARQKSRDAKRQSDIRQIATANELYYEAQTTKAFAASVAALTPTYLAAEPKDPSSAASYTYYTNGSPISGFCVWTQSESTSSTWYTYSDKGAGTKTSAPTSYATCAP